MGWGAAIRSSKKEKEKAEKAEMESRLQAGKAKFNNIMANRRMSGFDQFQAMQAARNSGQPAGSDRFQPQMGANPLILQQLQQIMGQRQMGPQFNAFGFGAQPGLAAQSGQGGGMLANMSSQGMNQLAAGQQNNPTIFKAKS